MSVFRLLHNYQDLLLQNNHITVTDTEVIISQNDRPYLRFSDSGIDLFGIDIFSKLNNNNQNNWNNFDSFREFVNRIDKHFVKLNHLGFGYRINSLEYELADIRNHLTPDFELVEEKSGDEKNNRWYFIKHKSDRSVPKIELVLYLTDKYEDYCPQFQIDIDTDKDFESIKNITDKLLGKDFFFWRYDIPGYGTIMAMGKVGQINGVNILAGVGTNLRKRQLLSKLEV